MKKKKKTRLFEVFLFWAIPILLLVAGTTYWIEHAFALDKPDYWPTQEWKTAAPEAEGVDSSGLAMMVDQLQGKKVHSFVVIRNGYIISEGYNSANDIATKQDILSVTKSITSSLIGIAINDKKINGVGERIENYFPELKKGTDSRKQQITLNYLLTMTPGFEWSNDNEASTNGMTNSTDWVHYVLGQPLIADPGTEFIYSNGTAHLLSAILQKATNKTEEEYANEQLFKPIGINNAVWDKDPLGFSTGAWGLHITTREMAKFGYLYLHDGKWGGYRVIPDDWVKKSIQQKVSIIEHTPSHPQRNYGYLWWLRNEYDAVRHKPVEYDMYSAIGSGGQRIVVIPKQNMIVVFTANNKDSFFADPIIDNTILTAIKSNKPLPSNPKGNSLLLSKEQAFKLENDEGVGF